MVLAEHGFVDRLVPRHRASVWAHYPQFLSVEPRMPVEAVPPDGLDPKAFVEALRQELAPVVESPRGIAGASGIAEALGNQE